MDEDAFDGLSPLERVRSFGYQAKFPGRRAKTKERLMAVRGLAFLCLGLLAAGCTQSTLEVASDAAMTPRDKKLLANAPYAQATIPEPYKRHIVTYHRKETAGAIVVDSDARYLYYVLPEGKAIRYGITVGEDALAFSGIGSDPSDFAAQLVRAQRQPGVRAYMVRPQLPRLCVRRDDHPDPAPP